MALDYGADLVYTEEIIDWRLLRSSRIVNTLIDTVDYRDQTDDTLVLRIAKRERGHLVLQIGTCDPDRAVRVAKIVEQDIDAIDVNMGCPKSFSLKGGMGAALLSHPDKITRILTSLVAAVNIPVTCKIRIFSDLEKTLDLVKVSPRHAFYNDNEF
jgi:tRNA-dihydrouridine synthase 2